VVWDLLLKADPEGPTLIVTAASAPRLSDHNGHPFCVPPQHTIVGMERGAGAHVTRDPLGQRLQERRHMTDPARHDGAVDLHR
jgi:hypothetical protein